MRRPLSSLYRSTKPIIAGNHAQALALAAKESGIPAYIVMPDITRPNKIAATKGYGANVIVCPRFERETTAAKIVAEKGARLVPPFNHPDVILGQATVGLELQEQADNLDAIIAPCSVLAFLVVPILLPLSPPFLRFFPVPDIPLLVLPLSLLASLLRSLLSARLLPFLFYRVIGPAIVAIAVLKRLAKINAIFCTDTTVHACPTGTTVTGTAYLSGSAWFAANGETFLPGPVGR